jgi:hypothetical protein
MMARSYYSTVKGIVLLPDTPEERERRDRSPEGISVRRAYEFWLIANQKAARVAKVDTKESVWEM